MVRACELRRSNADRICEAAGVPLKPLLDLFVSALRFDR